MTSWLAFAAVALQGSAPTSSLAVAVRAQLEDAAVVVGGFEQEKQLKGFKRPLKSSGDFRVERKQGIWWHTRHPFESELVVRPQEIVTRSGGTEVLRVDAAKEPAVRAINAIFLAVLAGDIDVLEDQFDVTGSVEPKTWTLRLTPKAEALRRALSRIELTGERFVRHLELVEVSGDVTRIRLLEPHSESIPK